MRLGPIDQYMARLQRELAVRGALNQRILAETREHLVDARERARQTGLPIDAAEQEAIEQFGDAARVAAAFAASRFRMLNWILSIVGGAAGIGIAYVDSRPTWDDTAITAFSMLLLAGVLALISPRRPWLWALTVGIWIPMWYIARTPTAGSLAMLLVLAFPFAGAYAGMALRRALA